MGGVLMSRKKTDAYVKETSRDCLYTHGDYLNWSDEKRYELINGQVYTISDAPYRRHQKVSGELLRQFANYLFDKSCEVYDAPFDVLLPEGEEDNDEILNVVQPDIVVICDKDKLDKRGCKGAPDLVIEIISPSSAVRDKKVKRDLYEKHGVKEYWIVDYTEKILEVYLLDENAVYGKPAVYSEEDEVSVNILENLEINLSYVFRD